MADEIPFLMRTYAPPPISFVRGEGVYLFDRAGRRYLDFVSGLGVNILGHCHPRIVRAVTRQARTLIHCSNLYRSEPQARLARRLCEASFADRAFFCNSGGEAIDTVIKIARYASHKRGERDRRRVVAFEGQFHGRTYGALSATSRRLVREGFEPLVPDVAFAPYNDLAAALPLIDERTCLVLVEPILGEGGIVPAERSFLEGLRAACDRFGALLAFDEVQSGLGRTGRKFAYEHYGVAPDLMTLGKGLAGGLPMAAVLAREPAASALEPGTHGTTFGGNPLSSAAALAATAILFRDRFLERVRATGRYLADRLAVELDGNRRVREIRGKGLMIGIELREPAGPYDEACRRGGLLVNSTAGTVLRLLPPLTVAEEHCAEAASILASVLRAP